MKWPLLKQSGSGTETSVCGQECSPEVDQIQLEFSV